MSDKIFEEPEILNRFVKLKQDYLAMCQTEGRVMVAQALDNFFKAFPNLVSAQWHQFTPGFNDGEPCTFSVGTVTVTFKDIESMVEACGKKELKSEWKDEQTYNAAHTDRSYRDGSRSKSPVDFDTWLQEHNERAEEDGFSTYSFKEGTNIREGLKQLGNFLDKVEDVLEVAFGNDKTVTVTQKTIEIEDYECGY